MDEPWPGFVPEQACWIHHRNEPATRWTYIVCGECGHAYTWLGLYRAWVRTGREMRKWNIEPPIVGYEPPKRNRFKEWKHRWFRRPSKIFFCQECVHDF